MERLSLSPEIPESPSSQPSSRSFSFSHPFFFFFFSLSYLWLQSNNTRWSFSLCCCSFGGTRASVSWRMTSRWDRFQSRSSPGTLLRMEGRPGFQNTHWCSLGWGSKHHGSFSLPLSRSQRSAVRQTILLLSRGWGKIKRLSSFEHSVCVCVCVCVCVKSLSHVRLFATPWTVAFQASLSTEFSRQEYWGGWPFPFPGHLPDPGIEPRSSALQADSLLPEPPGWAQT